MVGIGEMRMGFDTNESAEGSAGTIGQRVFVKQIAGGVGKRGPAGSGIEFLFLMSDGDREQIAASTFSYQTAQAFEARVIATEMQIQAHGRGIAFHCGGVNLQCGHILVPALRANVCSPLRRVPRSDRSLRKQIRAQFLSNDRKCSSTVTFAISSATRSKCGKTAAFSLDQPVKNFDRQLEFHPARDVNKGAGADLGTMQGRDIWWSRGQLAGP